MTRNLRNREHPAPKPVSEYELAPDFFGALYDLDLDVKQDAAETYSEWRDLHPYKPGMVVWLEYTEIVDGVWAKTSRKAYISDVFPDRDRMGDRRAKYRVHMANKKGDRFAKNWFYTWPGFVERGYEIAARLDHGANIHHEQSARHEPANRNRD